MRDPQIGEKCWFVAAFGRLCHGQVLRTCDGDRGMFGKLYWVSDDNPPKNTFKAEHLLWAHELIRDAQ